MSLPFNCHLDDRKFEGAKFKDKNFVVTSKLTNLIKERF